MTYFATSKGTLDNGVANALSATQEGHLEIAIHDPILPFGSLHSESLTPTACTGQINTREDQ